MTNELKNEQAAVQAVPHTPGPTERDVAAFLKNVRGMSCNCNLDSWQPEASTGHSWVCRIHKAATNPSAALLAEMSEAKATGAAA